MARISKPPLSLPSFSSFGDARQAVSQAFGNLQNWVVSILPVTDYSGSRISNVAPPQDADDVVTLRYLQSVQVPGQSVPYQAAKTGLSVVGVGGTGTGGIAVTQVCMSVPSEFTLSTDTITTAGTFAITKANESANRVWAGPSSGTATAPTFRSLVDADIPAGVLRTVGLVMPAEFTVSSSPVAGGTGTITVVKAVETSNTVFAGPSSGVAAAPTFRSLVAADLTAAPFQSLTTTGTSGAASLSGGVLNIPQYTGGGGGGGGAWTQLAQSVSPGATVTFSAISGSYNSLVITFQARSTSASVADNVYIQLNTDTGSNYDYNAGGVGSGNAVSKPQISQVTGATNANYSGQGEITLINYATTSFYKTVVTVGGYNNGSPGIGVQTAFANWRNTAAITSITIGLTGAGSFATGSIFTLYGVL